MMSFQTRTVDPETQDQVKVILASASPARLETLRSAGIEPDVLVSNIDEEAVISHLSRGRTSIPPASEQVATLAFTKGESTANDIANATGAKIGSNGEKWALLIACDSMLEFEGQTYGKPADAEEAAARISALQGKEATLWTGHHLVLLESENYDDNWEPVARRTATTSTTIYFGPMTKEEVKAYVTSGEPLEVAGAFTIDGLGGAFINGISGDPHSVVGISLPIIRKLAKELGIFWPALWTKKDSDN